MTEIKKVFASDFEKVYPLLIRFNEINLNKSDWEVIFKKRAKTSPDFFGYYLEHNEQAVGYIGLIFSERKIGKKNFKLANLTSWILLDEYKNYSIPLLYKALRLKDTILTAFTPNNTAYEIYKKLGFKLIESSQHLVLPFPVLFNSIKIEYNQSQFQSKLSNEDFEISMDHIQFNTIHIYASDRGGGCFCIFKKTRKKGFPLLELIYSNDYRYLNKNTMKVVYKLCKKLKVIGVLIEDRFVYNKIKAVSVKLKLKDPRRMYKGPKELRENIDVLYSELCFLHH